MSTKVSQSKPKSSPKTPAHLPVQPVRPVHTPVPDPAPQPDLPEAPPRRHHQEPNPPDPSKNPPAEPTPQSHGFAAPAGESASAAPLPRFKVQLNCPTPLLHKQLVVEAATDAEAWDKFCDVNGISGSNAERIIEPTSKPLTDVKAKK